MTEDEFQRIKEAEKKHLRAKKRLQRTLEALKQRNEVQSVVPTAVGMKQGAQRLLDETESIVDSLRRSVAQGQARFEVALDDEQIENEELHEAEEALREERAEALVRRMKAEQKASSRRPSIADADDNSDAAAEDDPAQEGPDKTIGRMGDLRADDPS